MIIMRKDVPIVILSLFLLLFCSSQAQASQAEWQINWQENGVLQETVTVTDLTIQPSDPGWQQSTSGNQTSFTRTVNSWAEYNQLQDKLPLTTADKNYIILNATQLSASDQVAAGTLYAGLSGVDSMKLTINVSGMILDSSVEPADKQRVEWAVNNPGQPFANSFSLQVLNLDGLMLGITILSLGVIGLFFFFIGRMRKVNRLIDETYSLDNVVIEDDEPEETTGSAEDSQENQG